MLRECYKDGRTPKKRTYIYFTIHIIYEINTPNKLSYKRFADI